MLRRRLAQNISRSRSSQLNFGRGNRRNVPILYFQLRFISGTGNSSKPRILNSFQEVPTDRSALEGNESRAETWNPKLKEQEEEFKRAVMSALKGAMGKDAEVYVLGEDGMRSFDQDDAVRVLEKSPKNADAWVALAVALDNSPLKPEEGELTEVVNGFQYNAGGCLLEAVTADPRKSEGWLMLGRLLGHQDLNAPGAYSTLPRPCPYSATECFIKAVSLNPQPKSWCWLGYLLEDKPATIHGKQYTPMQCYVESLNLDPSDSLVWDFLSHALSNSSSTGEANVEDDEDEADPTATIKGKTYTAFDCAVESLKRNLPDADLWVRVAAKMPDNTPFVNILGVNRSRIECFVEALERCHDKTAAWGCLSVLLKAEDVVQIGGKKYDRNMCLLKSIETTKGSKALVWLRLAHGLLHGHCEPYTVNGKEVGFRECLISALESEDPPAEAWVLAANFIFPLGGDVTVRGRQYSSQECLAEAARIDPSDPRIWIGLASGSEVTINGVTLTRAQCYQKALECNPNFQEAWLGLASCCRDASTKFKVNGVTYDLPKCLEKAIQPESTDPWYWSIIGGILRNHQISVTVDGVVYNEVMCGYRIALGRQGKSN
jgi:hypothetical protein